MSKRRKMSIVIFMIMMIEIFGQTSRVNAAGLQSNGSAGITAKLNDWVYYTRQMQAAGGTLGLTDKISDTDLSSSNKNFDVHFQKNTEYGAMALLSASSYGNPNKITDGATTTGNDSGVQIKFNVEWTAAAPGTTYVWALTVAKPRYWNNYGNGDGSNGKIGDATAETNGWHGSSGNTWLSHGCVHHGAPVNDAAFLRACCESIFGFFGRSYERYRYAGYEYCPVYPDRGASERRGSSNAAYVEQVWYGRAAIVVGSGV